jgi:hypothetical protein
VEKKIKVNQSKNGRLMFSKSQGTNAQNAVTISIPTWEKRILTLSLGVCKNPLLSTSASPHQKVVKKAS